MAIVNRKYIRYQNGVGARAFVQLNIEQNELEEHRVFVDTEKIPFQSQGLIEGGHENWNLAARAALMAALNNLKMAVKYDIWIKKLEGRIFLDTNNGCIGVACILALWDFLGIQAESNQLGKMDKIVRISWKQDIKLVPDFEWIFDEENKDF